MWLDVAVIAAVIALVGGCCGLTLWLCLARYVEKHDVFMAIIRVSCGCCGCNKGIV